MHHFMLKPFTLLPNTEVKGEFFAESHKICYHITGNLNHIKIPPYVSRRQRADKLWESTCFELFVKPKNSTEYLEFNFSPSNAWNAFHFDDYRQNKQEHNVAEPTITTQLINDCFSLSASLPSIPFSQCQIGISCVLACKDGSRSFWALSHLGEKPDFHISKSFVQLTS